MNLPAVFGLGLLLSTCAASDDAKLFMFTKYSKMEIQVQCATLGGGASSKISWTNANTTPEFLYQPGTRVNWSWSDRRQLKYTSSLLLPPSPNHYGREYKIKMQWITTGGSKLEEITQLPIVSPWAIELSVKVQDNAYIYLCHGDKPSKLYNCYWIIINGWPDQFLSTIRRCPEQRLDADGCTYLANYTGRIGQESQWLDVKVDWDQRHGDLKVSYKAVNDNDYKTVFYWRDNEPFTPKYFATRSNNKAAGYWQLRDYDVIFLEPWSYRKQLTSEEYNGPLVDRCLTFFSIMHPKNTLDVYIRTTSTDQLLGTINSSSSPIPGHWNGNQFKIPNTWSKDPKYFIFVGNSEQMPIYIDDVIIGDCNPDVEANISTITLPSNANLSTLGLKCHIDPGNDIQVLWNEADKSKALEKDISDAYKLCVQANMELKDMCNATILCSSSHCACSPGYWGFLCRPECGAHAGKNETRNKFGPGCSQECGYCASNHSATQRCTPITGLCPVVQGSQQCMAGYKPTMCTTKYLQLTSPPKLYNREPTSLELAFNLSGVDGDGILDELQVYYRNTVRGKEWVTKRVSVPAHFRNSDQFQVSLTNLTKSSEYKVLWTLVDTEGGIYRPPNAIVMFNTSCKGDLRLKESTNRDYPTEVSFSRSVENPDESCDLDAYTLQQTSPDNSSRQLLYFPLKWASLQPYTNYTFQLLRNNETVQTIHVETEQAAPSEPTELTDSAVNANSATLTWKHPEKSNGKIGRFELSFRPTVTWLRDTSLLTPINSTLDVSDHQETYSHTVHGLLPSTTYKVEVRGFTVIEGPPACHQIATQLAKIDFASQRLEVESRNDTSASLIIPVAINQLTNESDYFVLVVPKMNSDANSNGRSTEFSSTQKDELLSNLSKEERERAWIAAKLTPEGDSLKFVLGEEGGPCKSICNLQLNPLEEYIVRVVVVNKQGDKKEYSFLEADIAIKTPGFTTSPAPESSGLYALLLLLLIPALAVYLIYRYKFMTRFGGGEQLMLYPSKHNGVVDMPSVTKPACPDPMIVQSSRPPSAQILSVPVPENPSHIKIGDLPNYVHHGLVSGDLRKQHKMFPRGQTKPWEYGRLPQNKQKNRYGNLLAYDDTRVMLHKLPDDPYSDYINANYITGYRNPRMYIATQGPRSQTLADFWRMIWQENVQVIAMLTNLVESGKIKCEQYWPDSGQEVTYGSVKILTGNVQVFADYTFRHFHLQSTTNNETRKLLQLHFTSWPDHGVPLYPQSVASYLKKLLATSLGSGPMLVHCSAGVGRTGTIVVADACLRMAASEGAVDVLGFLRRARDCRPNMVDNYEQYQLIYQVLLECLVSESTALLCDGEFTMKLKALKESGGISKLYARLGDDLPTEDWRLDEDVNEAEMGLARQQQLESRQHKNRVQHIIPGSSGCVFLSRVDVNDPISDYINAVSVDGFRTKDQFIVTQFPLETTKGDFWRLVVEYKVSVVVALNEVALADETVCMFWPIPGAVMKPFPNITVILKEETPHHYWIMRQFLLIIQSDTEATAREMQVTMLHLIGWEFNDTLPKPTGLLQLWQETERVYSGDRPIIVCCYDGANACGLFLALSFLIEKMKLEQECDVVQAVRTVRHNRKQFVSSELQFEWLYDAANTYLEAFETYANFH